MHQQEHFGSCYKKIFPVAVLTKKDGFKDFHIPVLTKKGDTVHETRFNLDLQEPYALALHEKMSFLPGNSDREQSNARNKQLFGSVSHRLACIGKGEKAGKQTYNKEKESNHRIRF